MRRKPERCHMLNIDWLTLPAAQKQLTPSAYAHLANNGSLTRRVRHSCTENFEVRVIDHLTVRPVSEERALLNLPDEAQAFSRQVFLCCGQRPLIFARTLIGLTEQNRTLTAHIDQLGGESLGSLLFKDPLAKKRAMHLACIPRDHGFFDPLDMSAYCAEQRVWLRRSLYQYEGCELIVYEAFIAFPEVLEAI